MVEIFGRCLAEAEIFRRDVSSKSHFDWIEKEKDGLRWAILAAGISDETAEIHFKRGSQKASDATIPLQVAGGGRAEIFLQMRPIEWPNARPNVASSIAHYAPDEGIPLVEIAKGRISLDFDSDGRLDLFNLRWEVDPREAGRRPREDWLGEWWRTLGNVNPAHPSSHLHFNSQPKAPPGERAGSWDEPGENEFRLAIGDPNPLAFVLSVATWVRRNLSAN
jgi:hypothetical protein